MHAVAGHFTHCVQIWKRAAAIGINGISVQGEEITDLGPEFPELRTLGVDILRL